MSSLAGTVGRVDHEERTPDVESGDRFLRERGFAVERLQDRGNETCLTGQVTAWWEG